MVGEEGATQAYRRLSEAGAGVSRYNRHRRDANHKDIVDMLQGIVIVFVAAEAMFRGPLKKFGLMKKAKV